MEQKSMKEVLEERRLFSNIVGKEELTVVQSKTLGVLSDALESSFGPNGSNTISVKVTGNGIPVPTITKDGHSILKQIMFKGILEESTKESIVDMTQSIVADTGDGTTSTVLLSKLIFDQLSKIDNKTPYQIMQDFDTVVSQVEEEIYKRGLDFTPELAREIAYTSTNGNEVLANKIYNIYKEHGSNMHIELDINHGNEDVVYSYDGIVYDYGYHNSNSINTANKDAELINSEVYVFYDPINNLEMGELFNQIIHNNIINPMKEQKEIIPTTIITSLIGTDYEPLVNALNAEFIRVGQPPQILLIEGQARHETLTDMALMTDATLIRKYIDPREYAKDVESGKAPTVDTIQNFAGFTERVNANANKTTFVNPKNLDTAIHKDLINKLEAEVKDNEKYAGTIVARQSLKRRLRNITVANVIFSVGGVSASDRDNKIDLLDDAVKNCRSASQYGVGQGANIEALIALDRMEKDSEYMYIYNILREAYIEITRKLLRTSKYSEERIDEIILDILETGNAFNLRTEECDGLVKTSIKSDAKILDVLSKILTKLVTANQFLCHDPVSNIYM